MSLEQGVAIGAIIFVIVILWVSLNVISDRNDQISRLNELNEFYRTRGDKWQTEYYFLKDSAAIKDGYEISLSTEEFGENAIRRVES